MKKSALDRSLCFIESGSLSAHCEVEKSRLSMALISAGTVVGDGSFFSHLLCKATVTASSPCKLWCLNAMRFAELSNRHCAVAHELTLGMGGVLAKRLCHRQRRVAVTRRSSNRRQSCRGASAFFAELLPQRVHHAHS